MPPEGITPYGNDALALTLRNDASATAITANRLYQDAYSDCGNCKPQDSSLRGRSFAGGGSPFGGVSPFGFLLGFLFRGLFGGGLAGLFGRGRGGGGGGSDSRPSPNPGPKPDGSERNKDKDKDKDKNKDNNQKKDHPELSDDENELLRRAIAARGSHLALDDRLTELARNNSEIMDQRRFSWHFTGAGVPEIAFYGPQNSEEAIKGFLSSTAHSNILGDSRHTRIGVGKVGNAWSITFA